ncbi:MAG: VanZ family protein, partial [Ruminococcus sp.]|nr:VanZ family protein [Ruminococcus sp.]
IRKAAHFSEYCAIGFLSTGCAYAFCKTRPSKYTVQVLFNGLATAVCDETIQIFTPGRAGLITDVLIDFSGVLTGFAVALAYFWIYRRIRKRR